MGKYPYFPKVNSTWNKQQTFDGITIKEVTTPSTNPPANYMKLYFKADGKLYKLNSSGAETVSNATVSSITQALLDAKADLTNPNFPSYSDIDIITIPSNPSADKGRIYLKQIDANNDGMFILIKKAGSFVEVQIA